MSDPEDLQEGKRKMADWVFQLRRIGPPATCAKVPDAMRLNLGLTKVGRGQHNDYYLDSAVLKNFISRSHVEIFGKQNENGEIEFILTDKGLNGTFINDIRTHKTCTLEIGDKITFGHTNGYKIQPGSYAEQPQSEFQFVFEKIPRKSKTSEMFSESLSSPNTTPVEESSNPPDLKKDATIVSERLFKNSDIQSNVEQSPEKSAKSKSPHKGRTRKDSSSHSDNDLDFVSKNSSYQKGRRGSGKHNSESSGKSPISDSVSDSKRKVSTGGSKDVFSETLPAEIEDVVNSDDDDDNNDEIEEEVDEEEEEEEEEVVVKKKRGVRKGKTSAPPKKPVGRKKVVEPPSESEDSSDEDDSCKPEADQRPKSQAKQKPQQKKRRQGNDAPAVGSRKRRRKGGAASSSTASTSDNLEPGVEWYEDDTCDSADCKRPKKKRTPWVQCDDCDGWYHTVCVGANYNKLKDSDEHFNCGCD